MSQTAISNLPVTHLLYLHGFRSSPQSNKAAQVADHVGQHYPQLNFWRPQLPPSPAEAMRMLGQGVADWPHERMGVIGSSLGGFYATCLAQDTGCRAVVLNPAVHPARDLARHIGEQTSWHDPAERFVFEPRFVDELQQLAPATITCPERYFAIIAKGDEVLDWREMTARYPGATIELLEGGDHALTGFQAHLARVFAFMGLDSAQGLRALLHT